MQQTGTYSADVAIEVFTSGFDVLEVIELCWGDGSCEEINLSFSVVDDDTGIAYHHFESTHVYGYEDTFTLTVSECCWAGNILNIEQAVQEEFLMSTDFFLSVEDPLFGINSMPFFERGLLSGTKGFALSYGSGLIDPEGDSVKVELCEIDYVTTFNQPCTVYPGPTNNISLDTLTGNFQWLVPQLEGKYVLALCVTERRNDMIISEYTRYIAMDIDLPLSNEDFIIDPIIAFPNPVSDQLMLKIPESVSNPEILIFNAIGKRVSVVENNHSFDFSKLPTGVYFVILKADEQYFSKRVVKQ